MLSTPFPCKHPGHIPEYAKTIFAISKYRKNFIHNFEQKVFDKFDITSKMLGIFLTVCQIKRGQGVRSKVLNHEK